MNFKRGHLGYSLVELAMVISLMGMFAALAGLAYGYLSDRIKSYAAQAQLQGFVNYVVALRASQEPSYDKFAGIVAPLVLHDLTGNLWTDEFFDAVTPLRLQKSASSKNDKSWNNLMGWKKGAPLDPWGNPFTMDENEINFGPSMCIYDIFVSAGSDGILDGWLGGPTDDLYAVIPLAYCTAGPIPVTDGTQW